MGFEGEKRRTSQALGVASREVASGVPLGFDAVAHIAEKVQILEALVSDFCVGKSEQFLKSCLRSDQGTDARVEPLKRPSTALELGNGRGLDAAALLHIEAPSTVPPYPVAHGAEVHRNQVRPTNFSVIIRMVRPARDGKAASRPEKDNRRAFVVPRLGDPPHHQKVTRPIGNAAFRIRRRYCARKIGKDLLGDCLDRTMLLEGCPSFSNGLPGRSPGDVAARDPKTVCTQRGTPRLRRQAPLGITTADSRLP